MKSSTFIFRSYDFFPEKREIVFRYVIANIPSKVGIIPFLSENNELSFEEKLFLPENFEYARYDEKELDRALFSAHLMFGISYYKALCPREIIIESGELTKDQSEFWNEVYTKGLGEFFYENKIDFRGLVKFPHTYPNDMDWQKNKKLGKQESSSDDSLSMARPMGGVEGEKKGKNFANVSSVDLGAGHFLESPLDKGDLGDFLNKKYPHKYSVENFLSCTKFVDIKNIRNSQFEIPNWRLLLPLGGGKDSLTSLSLLEETEYEIDLFTLRDNPLFQETEELTKKKRLMVDRKIDPKVMELNNISLDTEGNGNFKIYNGHIPISACISFLSVIISLLYGYRYTVFSNERSSNFGNTEYLGMNINHQWSKSFDFEKKFGIYVKTYLTPKMKMLSLLRPFTEYKIVKIFSQHPKFFPLFSSCNRNFHISEKKKKQALSLKPGFKSGSNSPLKKWCGICPKCAFTFALLSAFLSRKELLDIFGKNLFADGDLIPLFEELLGIKNIKPFECVGEPEEVEIALWEAYKKGEFSEDVVMKMFEEKILPTLKNPEGMKEKLLEISEDHLIPEEMLKGIILKNKG